MTKRTIKIKIPGEEKDEIRTVLTSDYIAAKTKALREYGYGTLAEHEVARQLDQIMKDGELSIIGMFMKDDIVKP
jgi:hypothetical protein